MQAVAIKHTANVTEIKNAIAGKMDSATFTSWIAPLNFEIVNDCLVLSAQNRFSADFISSIHSATLNAVATDFGLNLQICVRGATQKQSNTIANDNARQTYTPAPVADKNALECFDSFISSDENAFVLSACKKIASGAVSFSPLFIYGNAGCGKSMLAKCINAASMGKTIMMSGGQFVAEFTRSLHNRTIFAFKDFCRDCDTFILDDVQILADKRATCEEFMQLVIDLRSAGKNIVLVANAAPGNLKGFDRRAQSLMASGLVADVACPNANVRRVMLMRAGIAADVATELANTIAADGHLISGIATKVRTYTELMGEKVNKEIAHRLLSDTLQNTKTPLVMVRTMCDKLGVSYDAVCGRGRSRGLVMARQTMMAVLKEATNLSLSEIGQLVGDRDHATVVYAIAQIEKMKQTDLVLAAQIAQLVAEYK
ncbi:MAG: DnaA/Hda family protein [Alphaproteobacteria bacterium]|nr:DnaA/Hda family protein [Alphaproteobacteria bacterium]